MRKGISAADFKFLSLVDHAHIDSVDDTELELAAVKQRHERARARIGLDLRLHRRCFANHFGQTTGQRVKE